MKRSLNSRAFTLLEILLGLAIFGIVSAVLYSTFSAGIRTNERSEKQSRVIKQAGWALESIALDLEQAVAYGLSELDEGLSAFDAQPDRLSLIVPSDSGLKHVSYYLSEPQQVSIYTTIIGQRTKGNVDIVIKDQQGVPAKILVREEKDLAEYLSKGDESDVEVLSPGVQEGGLVFEYQMSSQEGDILPLSVDVQVSFIAEDYPDGVLILRKHILLPARSFRFSPAEGI